MAFGLLTTETVKDYKALNARRKVYHQFPTGSAPFMAVLSMMPDEETATAEFGWWERRFPTLRTTLAASGTAPFMTAAGSALADPFDMVENTEYQVNVASTSEFKPTHVIEIRGVVRSGGTTDVKGTVTEVVSSTVLKFRPYAAVTGVQDGTTDNNSKTVAIIGTANQEYARSGRGIVSFPVKPTNFTQIFRDAFNISRTALKAPQDYDASGPYKQMAWENGLRHMVQLEKAFIFGQKHEVLVADPETGEESPEKKTGGVIWFLEQWEAADSVYRGGTGAAAITANSDDNKRIIDTGGTLSKADYKKYMARLFRKTNDRAYEKLCLCGGQHLETVNDIMDDNVQVQVAFGEVTPIGNIQFLVNAVRTLRGTVYYKVHPLFDEDPDLQGNGLYLDVGNLKFRPLTDSDTEFLKGRQENDRDGRKDEWITEAGLECRFPESHMYIKNANAQA
jgi:hypothetical protein